MPQQTSYLSESYVIPTGGYSPVPDLYAGADSYTSGQNVWVRPTGLQPRWKLSAQSIDTIGTVLSLSNVTNPKGVGNRTLGVVAFPNPTATGDSTNNPARCTVWVSGNTQAPAMGYYDTTSKKLKWQAMSANTTKESFSSIVTVSLSIRTDANWRGAVAYSAPLNMNVMVLAVGTASNIAAPNALLATSGNWRDIPAGPPLAMIVYSYLSGAAPKAVDVTNYADRIVAWNCDRIPQRVQWHTEGDPTDWTGLGSGYQDLADMNGYGTRIFSQADQMVLASTEEIWRGRYVGLPYVFSFSPIDRHQGMPYERATLQTPGGVLWLGADYMVRSMVGESIVEVGAPIQNYLRENLVAPEVAFLTYQDDLKQARLFYSTVSSSYPNKSVVYDFTTRTWGLESYDHAFHCGVSVPLLTQSAGGVGAGWDNNQHPFGVFAAQVTSAGTCGVFMQSANSDMGQNVVEQATFGTIQHPDLRHYKTAKELRVDVAAPYGASSLSFGFTTDNGVTLASNETLFSFSASSNASQLISYPIITGHYFTPHVRSTNGSWQMRRWYSRFESSGEAR